LNCLSRYVHRCQRIGGNPLRPILTRKLRKYIFKSRSRTTPKCGSKSERAGPDHHQRSQLVYSCSYHPFTSPFLALVSRRITTPEYLHHVSQIKSKTEKSYRADTRSDKQTKMSSYTDIKVSTSCVRPAVPSVDAQPYLGPI
jgi:hypothetical protein